jgi:hypothetical protein
MQWTIVEDFAEELGGFLWRSLGEVLRGDLQPKRS